MKIVVVSLLLSTLSLAAEQEVVDNFVEFLISAKIGEHRGENRGRAFAQTHQSPYFLRSAEQLLSTCDDSVPREARAVLKGKVEDHGVTYNDFCNLCFYLSHCRECNPSPLATLSKTTAKSQQRLREDNYDYDNFIAENTICGETDIAEIGSVFGLYPLILVGDKPFSKQVFLYALSKRIFLLSITSKLSKVHGGLYCSPAEVYRHDVLHFCSFFSAFKLTINSFDACSLGAMFALQKINMFSAIAQQFDRILRHMKETEHPDYKKVREIGYAIMHELAMPIVFPISHSKVENIASLIRVLGDNLKSIHLTTEKKSFSTYRKKDFPTYKADKLNAYDWVRSLASMGVATGKGTPYYSDNESPFVVEPEECCYDPKNVCEKYMEIATEVMEIVKGYEGTL